MLESLRDLFFTSGLAAVTYKQAVMIVVGASLVVLAIVKNFEPLLLIPIGFGCMLTNIPLAGITSGPNGEFPGGIFFYLYQAGLHTELFPVLIFLGIGALTDFGPLLANPWTILLGAAAQFGVFVALLISLLLGFNIQEAASIGIIGGADGPTSIYTAVKLAPHLLGPIAVAAYTYMSLVPLIQPPIMRALSSRRQRAIVMQQLRPVSKVEKIVFPITVAVVVSFIFPAVTPIIGMIMLGNLFRECGVVDRLKNTAANELINIVTILLATTVGSTMTGESFITTRTIGIIGLGLVAFMFSTIGGMLLGQLFYWVSGGKVNPLIGSAGVSAVPMAARVSQRVGQRANPANFLLMHAMGPNVAGVIGTAVAAGVMISLLAR